MSSHRQCPPRTHGPPCTSTTVGQGPGAPVGRVTHTGRSRPSRALMRCRSVGAPCSGTTASRSLAISRQGRSPAGGCAWYSHSRPGSRSLNDSTSAVMSGCPQRRQVMRFTRPGSNSSVRCCSFFISGSNHTVVSASVVRRTPSAGPWPSASRLPWKSKPGAATSGWASGLRVSGFQRDSTACPSWPLRWVTYSVPASSTECGLKGASNRPLSYSGVQAVCPGGRQRAAWRPPLMVNTTRGSPRLSVSQPTAWSG